MHRITCRLKAMRKSNYFDAVVIEGTTNDYRLEIG